MLFDNVAASFYMQATLTDKAVGTLLILAALIIFLYYTLWVVVLVRCLRE